MSDEVKFLLAIILSVVLIFGLIFGIAIGIDSLSNIKYCQVQQSLSPQLTFQWKLWTGCLVKLPDNTWANAGEWINTHRLELNK